MRSGRYRGSWLLAAVAILATSFILALQAQQVKKVDDTALKNSGKTGEE